MRVNFLLAEVIENTTTDTYTSDINTIGQILVSTFDEDKTQQLLCNPANSRQKDIPLIGEHVLIFQGTNQYSTAEKTRRQWYYFPAYGIQTNINNDALPGITVPSETPEKLGLTFKEKLVSHIQSYEGDTILEGRFSNSIRLGSTINGGEYSKAPTWAGNTNGDPIIILSNGHKDLDDGTPTIESFKKSDGDRSSIYLTSLQRVSDLNLFRTPTKSAPIETYQSSQLIGDADRIILRAKVDSIILDSPNRITLGAPEIRIGNENAGHALVKGDVLKMILNDLVGVINAGVIGPAGIASSPIMQGKLIGLLSDIGKLNSTKH